MADAADHHDTQALPEGQPALLRTEAFEAPEAVSELARASDARSLHYVVEPLEEHRYSIIILHGRGDNGKSFGQVLIGTDTASYIARRMSILLRPVQARILQGGTGRLAPAKTSQDQDQVDTDVSLREAIPNARFIMPTAAPRASTRFKGWKLNQWFDSWSLWDITKRPELQNEGLRENAAIVEALIEEEAAKVGIENVLLGGLSNGSAMALMTLLLMSASGKLNNERRLGGVFGLCGWLPYWTELKGIATDKSPTEALSWLHGVIQDNHSTTETTAPTAIQVPQVPVFLGHGRDDNTVPIARFGEAAGTLLKLGFKVDMKSYNGLEHWYSDEMLKDLLQWMRSIGIAATEVKTGDDDGNDKKQDGSQPE